MIYVCIIYFTSIRIYVYMCVCVYVTMILPSGKQACDPTIATVAPLTVGRARRAFNMSLAWALKEIGTVVSPRKVRVNVPSVALQVT